MRFSFFLRQFFLLFVVTCGSAGCGSSDPWTRIPLTGTVTFAGKTDLSGTITLIPTEGIQGPSASTSIVDGKFAFTAAQGPVAGKHLANVRMEMPASASTRPAAASAKSGGAATATAASPPEYYPKKQIEVVVPAAAPFEVVIVAE